MNGATTSINLLQLACSCSAPTDFARPILLYKPLLRLNVGCQQMQSDSDSS